jgi:hypothetical protein
MWRYELIHIIGKYFENVNIDFSLVINSNKTSVINSLNFEKIACFESNKLLSLGDEKNQLPTKELFFSSCGFNRNSFIS